MTTFEFDRTHQTHVAAYGLGERYLNGRQHVATLALRDNGWWLVTIRGWHAEGRGVHLKTLTDAKKYVRSFLRA
jgi:hypothetical protein